MRKLLLCGILMGVMCFVSGCGNNASEERLKTAEEQAMELQKKAEDAVEEVNEDTMKLNETADAIEDVIEE